MAENRFKIKNGLVVEAGGSEITGSLNAPSITGSLWGTASWASNAVSASSVGNLTQNLVITGSVTISGSAVPELFVLGDQQITGSLRVTNGVTAQSVSASFTGSLTGILTGTASWANNSITASNVEYTNVVNKPSLFSGSSQVQLSGITGTTFAANNFTFPQDLIIQGNLTAQQFIVSSSVAYITTSFSSGSTIFGNSLDDTHRFTGSVFVTNSLQVTGSVNIFGGISATSLTGSLTASSIQGAILNSQLQNSSITVGNTNISLGGTSTTLTGLTSINGTNITASIVSASSFTGSISASYLQGPITNTQLQNSSVTIGSTAISLGTTQTTIAGLNSITTTNITGSIISASNFISGGQIIATTGFTGSISASGLRGAILNTQLQNSSVTVGSTNIALGGTSTTLTGLSSVSSTSLTGSLTASSLQGAITNTQLQNSSITVGTTAISLGSSATTVTGLISLNSTNITASVVSASSFTGSLFGTASWANNVVNASTASYLNPLNQGNVIITGSVIISGSTASLLIGGNVTASTEASLIIGIPPSGQAGGEGGQIILQSPGGTYTSASMWDNYQNQTRLLRGNNTTSDAVVAQFDMHTKQVQFAAYNSTTAFTATPLVGLLGFDSSGRLLTTTTVGSSVFPFVGIAVISGGLQVTGSAGFTGSVNVINGGFTGSLFGTASYVTGSIFSGTNPALSASYSVSSSFSQTASFVNPLNQTVIISGSLIVTGSTNLIGNTQLTGSLLLTQSYISTVDWIDFTKTVNPPHSEGRVHWVDDTKTLQVDTDVANLMIELGHQQVVRVRNENPFTIAKGKIIYISGSSGNRPLIFTSSIETDRVSAGTVGMVAADIAQNNNGYVITRGTIRDINTIAYNAGQLLYLSTSGDLSTTAPEAPLHEVRIGKVVTSATAGIVYIDIMNGYEIGELHDVVDTNGQIGDLLVRSGSSPNDVWKNTKQLTGSYGVTGSWNVLGNINASAGFTGSLLGTSSWANNSLLFNGANSTSFITTSSIGVTQTISGSLIINQNLTVLGSSSIVYITSSQLDISTNIITVNTDSNTIRFGGLAVIDSGSIPQQSGSFLYDSVQDEWIFVHRGSATSGVTSSHFLVGPETYNNLGNETYVPNNVILKSQGNEHVTGSNITDDGSNIYLYTNTQITGSLNVKNGITGSVSASSLQGAILNTQLQNSSVTIGSTNIALGATSTTLSGLTQVSATGITASLLGTASFVTGSIYSAGNLVLSASYTLTASYALNAGGSGTGFPFTGSAQITGSLGVTGSITVTNGGFTGSISSSNLQGAILNTQLQNSSVTVGTTAISLGGSATTIAGISSITSTNETASIISASNHISGGQIIAATGFTGSLSASFLKGAILNTQLQNSSVTVGTTAISLGSSATTITGLTSINSTSVTASIVSASSFTGSLFGTASYVTGSIHTSTNPALSASYALTASYALNAGSGVGFPFTGSAQITGSLGITGSVNSTAGFTGSLFGSSSYAITASYALNATSQVSIEDEGNPQGSAGTLNFVGNGVTAAVAGGTATITINGGAGTSDFPYTGSAIISGSLKITGSLYVSGTLYGDGSGLTNLGFGNTRKLVQSTPSTTWSFAHNMGERYPTVTVYDSNDNVIIPGRIEAIDGNNIKVYFDTAQSGILVTVVAGRVETGSVAVYTQSTPASIWTFTHNLGYRYALISVFDAAGDVIIPGRIETVDQNIARIYFDVAQDGTAVAMLGGTAITDNAITASFVTGSIFTSNNPALSASNAVTASFAFSQINYKSNIVTSGQFGGTPKTASVVFANQFDNTNYSVTITGEDARTWTVESKLNTGFTINSNSNTTPTGNTYWVAMLYGETV